MAIITQKRILNLIPKTSAPVTIHVSQGNVGETIEFTLVKGDELFTATSDLTATVHGVRSDGANFGPYTCTLNESKVSFTLRTAMAAISGAAVAEIVLVNANNRRVGSSNFAILVEDSAFPVGVTYSNDTSVYEAILTYVQGAVASMNTDLTDEISARMNADSALNTRIDEIIAPSGGAPSAAEVTDARISADNITYNTLGNSIRAQTGELKVRRNEFLLLKSEWNTRLTSKSDAEAWVTNKPYKPGFISNVEIYVDSDTDQECAVRIFKKTSNLTGTFLYEPSHIYGHGVVRIPVNYLVDSEFFVAIKASKCKFGELFNEQYYAVTADGNSFTINESSAHHYYHAYEVHMLNIYDLLNNEYAKKKYAIVQSNETITSESDILEAEANRLYLVSNNADWQALGLPAPAPATLIKFSPISQTSPKGYCVFLYCTYDMVTGETNLYYAYGAMNTTIERLVWHKFEDDRTTFISMGISNNVDNSYMENNNYNSVIDLPFNKTYIISGNLSSSYGLPIAGYGTLFKYSGHLSNANTTGFIVYLYTVLRSSTGTVEMYFAFSQNNQTIETLQWTRIGEKNKGIQEIGLTSKIVGFIGDSITEGFGSSDYNGGSRGTSGHLIPNNVKTWYRNTGTKCWANKMIAYIENTYANASCFNNAIGGFTTKNIYDNLETLTLDDEGNRANVIVLMIGTNDGSSADKKATITRYLIKVIQWLQVRGIQPIILTNTPLIGRQKPNNAETIQSAVKLACDGMGIPCYDLLSEINNYMWEHDIPLEASLDQTKFMRDNLHPADPGYEIIFELVKKIIRL